MNKFFQQRQQRGWAEILFDLFMAVKGNVQETVHEKQTSFVRRIFSFALLTIGMVFLLVGVSLFIGTLINQTSWSGYILVGFILAVLGFLIHKK